MNLFKKRKTVLYITSTNLEGGNITFSKEPTLSDYSNSTWSEDNLNNIIKALLTKLNAKKVILALGEGFIKIVNVTVPNNLPVKEELMHITQEVKKVCPEIQDTAAWMFKEIAYHTDKKEVLAYTPIVEKYKILTDALQAAKCTIEGIQPDIVAKARNENVLLGAALEHMQENDVEKIPLLQLTKNTSLEVARTSNTPTKWLLGLILLGALLIVGAYFVTERKENVVYNTTDNVQPEVLEVKETTESVEQIKAETEETADPAVQKEEFKAAAYSIQILNGTTVEGLAAKTSEKLKEAGFVNVEIGNADNTEQEKTEILFNGKPDNVELKITILDLLELNEGSIKPQADAAEYDVLIILGQDLTVETIQ